MKHVMEVRDANIDELHSNISTIEREKSRLQKDLKHLSGDSSKLAQLEQDNRKLVQECTVDKRNIIQLRESLVEEKLKSESHSSELEATYDKLKKLGIDQSSLDGEVELVSNERMKNLEGSMSQLLEARQKKIASLETALKGKEYEKSELQQSLEFMKLKIQSGDSKAGLESELAKVVKERNQAQGELINLKMEVEGSKDRVRCKVAKCYSFRRNQIRYLSDWSLRGQNEETARGDGQYPGGKFDAAITKLFITLSNQSASNHSGHFGDVKKKGEIFTRLVRRSTYPYGCGYFNIERILILQNSVQLSSFSYAFRRKRRKNVTRLNAPISYVTRLDCRSFTINSKPTTTRYSRSGKRRRTSSDCLGPISENYR